LGFGFGKIEVKEPPGGAVTRFGFAEFEQEILRREFHDLKSLQPVQQAAELTHTHRAFLSDAVAALGKDEKLALLALELDIDAFAHVLRLAEKIGFKLF
jgi:hypothetical protein